jgi:hypothetical protein
MSRPPSKPVAVEALRDCGKRRVTNPVGSMQTAYSNRTFAYAPLHTVWNTQ